VSDGWSAARIAKHTGTLQLERFEMTGLDQAMRGSSARQRWESRPKIDQSKS
jgi:hypothetical protein